MTKSDETWSEWIKGCLSVCPFAAKSSYVVMEPEHDTAFITLPDYMELEDLKLIVRMIAPALHYHAGLTAVGLHPAHPFQFRGKYTRRSPHPAIQLTRRSIGDPAREALKQTTYYDDYPEDDMQWGLEDVE